MHIDRYYPASLHSKKPATLERSYQVWVFHDGSPLRRIAERLTLKEAQDKVTLETKLNPTITSREFGIMCAKTGRFLTF